MCSSDLFPVAEAHGVPVIAYTALRWGALLRGTPDDPPGFEVPRASAWYRFVLQRPGIAVVLAAPENREELREVLRVLDVAGPLDDTEYTALARHGQRVRRWAGAFP